MTKLADDKRNRDAREDNLGFTMTGATRPGHLGHQPAVRRQRRSTGATHHLPLPGPMTADLDRGKLKMHYDLGTNGRPRCRGRHGGIGMTMQMSVNGTWWVRPRMASSKPRVIPPGTSQVNADFRGHARAPANQSQTSSGSGPVEASGIYTRETTGTITSIGVKAAHHLHAHQAAVLMDYSREEWD